MAGAGYKLFNTGDVLTAAQVNTYLNEQTVMVFASSAARTSALSGVLAEGMMSYLQDTNAVQVYNGSAWVSVGGGASPLTTKGDLYTFSTVDARLGVGANNTVLTADSAEATGLKWAAPSAPSNPAFRAFRNTSTQSITASTWTKVELNAETFDTASCFDSTTNYRFTPNVAGYYSLQGALAAEAQTTSTVYAQSAIYKNGAVAALGTRLPAFADDTQGVVHDIIYLNGTSDYVELYGFVLAGSVNENFINGTTKTFFTGVWIRS